eukprot:gene5250-biopygen8698
MPCPGGAGRPYTDGETVWGRGHRSQADVKRVSVMLRDAVVCAGSSYAGTLWLRAFPRRYHPDTPTHFNGPQYSYTLSKGTPYQR